MPDKNFLVKNGLTVNTNFVVNSTSLSYSGNSTFNGTNTVINSNTTFNANLIISTGIGVSANGSFGSQGQLLYSNGSSVYWANAATTVSGSNQYVQFNDNGAANGSPGFLFNKATNNISVSNSVVIGSVTFSNTSVSQNTFTFGTAAYHVSNGFFGIGNSVPVARLHVQGDVVVSGDVTSAYSDDRLKSRISNITEALDKVKQLSGFIYVPSDLGIAVGITDGASLERKVGLSAQEVQKVLPEVVKPSAINPEYLTVQYEKLVPLLIEAIKELEAKVNSKSCSCGCGGK